MMTSYDSWNAAKNLTAGAIAGAVSRTITSPLERLKVMQQVQTNHQMKYNGLIQSLQTMYKEEGILSYWKGNGANIARIAPHSAIQFFCFDFYKQCLSIESQKDTKYLLLCGGLAGMTSTFICYPLDLVRSYLTVQTVSKKYHGIFHGIRSIVKNDGILSLYKGLGASLMGIAPFVAINFSVFHNLKNIILPAPTHPAFDLINFSLGAIAGFTSAAITYPTDVIRRRIQLGGVKIDGLNIPKYNGIFDCVKDMALREGYKSFYKGLNACLLKVVPAMAIAFMVHERLRKLFKFEVTKSSIKLSS